MSATSIGEELDREELEQEPQARPSGPERRPGWLEWLKSEPGPGEVGDYLGHPLNWDHSEPVARVLRGLTGLIGNLRLAIVDLVVGSLQLLSRSSAKNLPPAPPAGGPPGVGGA